MADIAYFYKDSVTGVYMINGNAVSKGNYILNSYTNDTIIEIISKTNNAIILGPIEISNIKKENTNSYSNLAELLNDTTTFFIRETVIPPSVTSNIKYGYLYNGYAASNVLLAPEGWHIPTLVEITELADYLGGDETAGSALKEIGLTHWVEPNADATNSSGFYARGAGRRWTSGEFQSFGEDLHLWTSEELGPQNYTLSIYTFDSTIQRAEQPQKCGLSVRFIKNDSVNPGSLTDIEGNIYRTCKIGNQVWLADNWACRKLNDETPIPNVTNDAAWAALTTLGRCAYNNDESNVFL